uniref:Uncharacterized protein n=1 Tax=Arundo donax TaxID=35708 RepID=A0A0A9CSB7_ARUDO
MSNKSQMTSFASGLIAKAKFQPHESCWIPAAMNSSAKSKMLSLLAISNSVLSQSMSSGLTMNATILE